MTTGLIILCFKNDPKAFFSTVAIVHEIFSFKTPFSRFCHVWISCACPACPRSPCPMSAIAKVIPVPRLRKHHTRPGHIIIITTIACLQSPPYELCFLYQGFVELYLNFLPSLFTALNPKFPLSVLSSAIAALESSKPLESLVFSQK